MSWFTCLDVILLGLMLAYVLVIVVRTSYRGRLAQHAQGVDVVKLIALLRVDVGRLKSIGSAAPYLGLVGASVGALSGRLFSGSVNMERNAFELAMASRMSAGLVATAAGILVAIPAACSYNCLRMRLDLLAGRTSLPRFPLRDRFSQLPAFAVVAAPGLALIVAVYTPFFSPRVPTGLAVELAPTHCGFGEGDRLIVLRVSSEGRVFLNFEEERWDTLANRLSQIYRVRENRTLYVLAEDEVPYQTVADVIDLIQNTPAGPGSESLNIRARLITPTAKNVPCFTPFEVRRIQKASR